LGIPLARAADGSLSVRKYDTRMMNQRRPGPRFNWSKVEAMGTQKGGNHDTAIRPEEADAAHGAAASENMRPKATKLKDAHFSCN
jgi:hypothetical protein